MNIADLKKIGATESKLSKLKINTIKESLSEYADDPEVAKAIAYMNQYQEALPEIHPIFKYVETLKTKKDSTELAKEFMKSKKAKKEQEEQEDKSKQEENQKKQQSIKDELNKMLKNLETETDKIFEFLTKNQKSFYGDHNLVANALKTRRFLISTKNGFKYAKMR